MWEGHSEGGSLLIEAGDGAVVTGTGRRELECSRQRSPEGSAAGGSYRLLQEMERRSMTLSAVSWRVDNRACGKGTR